jgi:mannose-1-phosphate guanylyltransferase
MAGGGGTRFWPRSRQKLPKQFLHLVGEGTLIQQALGRIEAQAPPERTWVITAANHSEQVIRQLPGVPAKCVVGEPLGRDTAACIGLGAALIQREDPDAVIVVMPADHIIEPVQEFRRAIHAAEQLVAEKPTALVTFGVPPTFPATGYGYIHRGAELPGRQGVRIFQVAAFREKPAAEVAERYVASGEYFWNAGIFVWKAKAIMDELASRQPKLHQAVQAIAAAWGTPQQDAVFRQQYEGLERLSIDYAVMEGAKEVQVVQAPFQWDDVGSWQALERHQPQDADGNTVLANHVGLETNNCIIAGTAGHLIATVGVDHLLIVQDGDITLVADRRDEGAVKQLVELLKQRGLEKYL